MSTPEISPYLFAGDVHLQKMRVEEKATYPVHRYAPSFNLYENDSVTGYKLIRFLVQQCHQHDELVVRSEPKEPSPPVEEAEKAVQSTDPNPSEAIFDLDNEFKEKFAKSDLPWNSNAYYQRASVTILSDTDLTDKASDQTLKAIRISDRQTVVEPEVDKPAADQSTTPESKLSNEKFPDDTLLVLSLDSVRFGLGEDHEFKLLTEACDKYGDIVARLSIPRSSIYKPAETKKFKTFITNFAGFVEKQKEKDSDRTRTRILVVSSE